MFKFIPIVFILIFLPSLSIACLFDGWQSTYALEEVQKDISFTLPITSKREAIGYAKSQGFFELPPYDELKQNPGYKNWVVSAVKRENIWRVWVNSVKGIVPGYSCHILFNESGKILNSPEITCGFNK